MTFSILVTIFVMKMRCQKLNFSYPDFILFQLCATLLWCFWYLEVGPASQSPKFLITDLTCRRGIENPGNQSILLKQSWQNGQVRGGKWYLSPGFPFLSSGWSWAGPKAESDTCTPHYLWPWVIWGMRGMLWAQHTWKGGTGVQGLQHLNPTQILFNNQNQHWNVSSTWKGSPRIFLLQVYFMYFRDTKILMYSRIQVESHTFRSKRFWKSNTIVTFSSVVGILNKEAIRRKRHFRIICFLEKKFLPSTVLNFKWSVGNSKGPSISM